MNEELPTRAAAPPQAPSKGRRSLIVGGALGLGISTLPFRPALANTCTVSGSQSVSPSHQTVACLGLTVGYYKNHPTKWPGGYQTTSLYKNVFGSGHASPTSLSFIDALNGNGTVIGGVGNSTTLAQAVTAVLNAANYGAAAFGYDVAGIVAYINANWNDPNLTANLDLLNNRQ
jgi:hypothetical protein